jgi:hypothetical protein
MDIQTPKEFGVRWRGRFLRPSKHAIREMVKLGIRLVDLVELLESGEEPEKPRSKTTIERTVVRGTKIIKIVLVESYAYDIEECVWLVKHFGGR